MLSQKDRTALIKAIQREATLLRTDKLSSNNRMEQVIIDNNLSQIYEHLRAVNSSGGM